MLLFTCRNRAFPSSMTCLNKVPLLNYANKIQAFKIHIPMQTWIFQNNQSFLRVFITTFSLTSNNISTNLPFLLLVVTVTRQPRNLWRHDSNALCGETPHAILIFYCVYDKSYGIVPPWTTPEKVASYLCSMVDVVTGFWLYRSAIYTITQLIFILQ